MTIMISFNPNNNVSNIELKLFRMMNCSLITRLLKNCRKSKTFRIFSLILI